MKFEIEETNILYCLVVIQSVLGIILYTIMYPVASIGYYRMIELNDAYEFGIAMHLLFVGASLYTILAMMIGTIAMFAYKIYLQYMDEKDDL